MTAPDPGRLINSLRESGWVLAGSKHGVYVRLAWPNAKNRSLLIPLDQSAPDFEELMRAVLSELEAAMFTGQAAGRALVACQPDLYSQYA